MTEEFRKKYEAAFIRMIKKGVKPDDIKITRLFGAMTVSDNQVDAIYYNCFIALVKKFNFPKEDIPALVAAIDEEVDIFYNDTDDNRMANLKQKAIDICEFNFIEEEINDDEV